MTDPKENLRNKIAQTGLFNKRANVYVNQLFSALDGLSSSCVPFGDTRDEERKKIVEKIVAAIDNVGL